MTAPIVVNQQSAAAMLSVSTKTVKRWTDNGTIPSVTLGGLVRYRVADLESLVASASSNQG
ncbi:helix-turn-helix domain-containing protein [Microbacterium sp. GXF6406]